MPKNKISDLTFIGSGISTSFSIINLLNRLEKHEKVKTPLSINIIEKYSEFFTGIPYGSRSGYSTMLITSLKDFLPEPELSMFIYWLIQNKTWLLKEFEKEGGILSRKWINDNKEDIKNNKWEELFIPRRFFGFYIELKVKSKIKELNEKGLVEVRLISGKVMDLKKGKKFYTIILDDTLEMNSKKVVLSIGSLPINYLWSNKHIIEEENLLFINNPYKPDLSFALNKLDKFLVTRKNNRTDILVVGANASALELIYKIYDYSNTVQNNTKFTILSTYGKLPDGKIDLERQREFMPNHLNKLKNEKFLTAKLIAEATFKDLDYADKINLGPASTVDIISKYFGDLLKNLDIKELKEFACLYGNKIGKRQRCAGPEYLNVITFLERQGKFNHIPGRFKTIIKRKDNNYFLKYIETVTKKEIIHNNPFQVVINCTGSKNLTQDDIPLIYKNLINKNYCIPNDSKIGFHVNDTLQAQENLYIMGPLLAGNIVNNMAIWHMEHCGRIISVSKILSNVIYEDLLQNSNISL